MGDLTLDVPDPQVLVNFPHDANGLTEHHRLLLCKLGPGRWVACSPDMELEVLDLNMQRHTVLGRRAPYPAHLQPVVYGFDPISRADLERLKREAKTMSIILGDEDTMEVEARVWLFSDPSSDRLGKSVPIELVPAAVTLGSRGLVEIDGVIEAIEEVPESQTTDFAENKRGTYGELRTLGNHTDSQDKRYIALSDAFPLMKEVDMKDWCFEGPRATKEFLGSIVQGTADLSSYHLQWLQHSGVNPKSSIAYEHKCIIECLRLAICKDQLDPTNLMCLELLTRRVIQLEVAVSRSPTSPEFQGLDILMESPITTKGAASTKALDTWLTSRLKEQANIQKQARLYREEVAHRSKSSGSQVDDGQGAVWRRRKPKGKAKAGASAGGTGAGEA